MCLIEEMKYQMNIFLLPVFSIIDKTLACCIGSTISFVLEIEYIYKAPVTLACPNNRLRGGSSGESVKTEDWYHRRYWAIRNLSPYLKPWALL